MKLVLHPFDLQLKETFQTSSKSIDVQKTLIVELQYEGKSGFGEATANPYYGITIESLKADLISIKSIVENHKFNNPEQLWEILSPRLDHNYFALCAVDVAANDLFGKLNDKPLYQLWGLQSSNLPVTNYTLGIASIDKMVEKLLEHPWPLYKIKLGTENDIAIVKALRAHTDAVFRTDANCGWNAKEAIEKSFQLKELGVEFIEQPLKADDWKGMEKVKESSALPCIADESCRREEDVVRCSQHFNGINIKLMKCGGLTPARRMISEGRKLGLKIMVGCMTESSIGISAIAQLLPLLDYVDMDGALLLANDVAEGVEIDKGIITLSKRPGTGGVLKKAGIGV